MKLTIITITFNAEAVIENTIKSVLNQSENIYEYIFIDGASSDNTVSIIEKYRCIFENKKIRYMIKSEPDKGISDAFNKGLELATGNLIGIINADDELNTDCVKLLRKAYEDNDADIFYGDCIWRDTKGFIYKKPGHKLNRLLYNMILYHPATFVKKNCYDDCGKFDISYKYCMDKHFLYRCYVSGKRFQYINNPLVIFKAGGISDIHAKEVYLEGSRMALEFGEPRLKVKLIELMKIAKRLMVNVIKQSKIYERTKYIKV